MNCHVCSLPACDTLKFARRTALVCVPCRDAWEKFLETSPAYWEWFVRDRRHSFSVPTKDPVESSGDLGVALSHVK